MEGPAANKNRPTSKAATDSGEEGPFEAGTEVEMEKPSATPSKAYRKSVSA
jgi:hypothetical protein